MRPVLVAILAALSLGGCQPSAPKTAGIDDAWVRLAAVPDRPAAAYFTLHGGATPDRLVAVTSDKVARIELHEGGMAGGMATMKPISGVDVPAGDSVTFAPGGNHAMLFDVDPALKPGTPLPLRFRFKSGRTIDAEAKTIAAGDETPEHAAH